MPMFSDVAALILAGGRGARLAPEYAPFTKPLREVGGKALFRHAFGFAREFDVAEVVIVVAPENADSIRASVDATERRVPRSVSPRYVVQYQPTGVVDAVWRGIADVADYRPLLFLCADNTFQPGGGWFRERARAVATPNRGVIGVAAPVDDHARYSRVTSDGIVLPRRKSEDLVEPYGWWLGPVLLPRTGMIRDYLRMAGQTAVEDLLNAAGAPFATVTMNCRDHGVL